jgi:S1/P1 Nuclease
VDIEIDNPDISSACAGRGPLPPNTAASNGPPACVFDKINQFSDEFAQPGTDPEERLVALKFLLHFVGDLHQPLHSSDNHDRDQIKVVVDGFPHNSRDELHAYWDTQFVRALGRSPKEIAQQLMDKITPDDVKAWSAGTPDNWAMEAFKLSKADVYGNPPHTKNDVQRLDEAYVDRVVKDVAPQLSRAGVRLAAILNNALSSTKGAATSASTSNSVPRRTAPVPTTPDKDLTTQTSGRAYQFQTELEAKGHCPTGSVVWANLRSSVYHFAGYPSYGNTKRGAYMCELDAARQGMHAAKAERHP